MGTLIKSNLYWRQIRQQTDAALALTLKGHNKKPFIIYKKITSEKKKDLTSDISHLGEFPFSFHGHLSMV